MIKNVGQTEIIESKMVGIKEQLNLDWPVIMAPMFLVSNEAMVVAAMQEGIAAAIPSLNFRTTQELRDTIRSIREKTTKGALGINLIVNKSNVKLSSHLETCVEEKVDFFITSLGSPKKVIEKAHAQGIKVYCDVVDLKYALKVQELGADGVIAVNNQAGGHAGPQNVEELIKELTNGLSIPVISAGGIGTSEGLKQVLEFGADAASIGTVFIATEEAPVSAEYKNAIISYGANDIVMTTKLSGTPCTVINTPYVQETGTKQNVLERILNSNKRLKKIAKMITFVKGMGALRKAAFSNTYKTVWCAGPSIQYVHEIRSVKQVIEDLLKDLKPQKG